MFASPQWKWLPRISLVAAIGIIFAAWTAVSDERPAADAPHRVPVAIIDIAKVFKQGREFNDKMNRMKAEIDQFDREIRNRQAEMQKLYPKESGSAPSSSDKTEQAAQLAAGIQDDVNAKKQSFLAAEARMYADTYAAIEKIIVQISRARDIGVVLRYTSDPLDPTDRASVLQGVNRPVVYWAVPDLTGDVLASLNGEKP